MPIAVVNEEAVREDLKSLPEGYVMVKRMSYGEKLQRRGYNSKMEMRMQRGSKDATSYIDMFKEEMELYDFAHAIGEHNLTKWVNRVTGQITKLDDPDGEERPLDFTKPADVKSLPGQIAEEIGTYISKHNDFEMEEETGK